MYVPLSSGAAFEALRKQLGLDRKPPTPSVPTMNGRCPRCIRKRRVVRFFSGYGKVCSECSQSLSDVRRKTIAREYRRSPRRSVRYLLEVV